MYHDKRIAVVVPCFNEERFIGQVITTMPDLVDDIVVINDASTDDTLGAIRRADDPRVRVIDHEQNKGVGGSVIDGHKEVIALGADVVLVMAGDAQCDPVHIPALLAKVVDDGYDYAKGNRFYSTESWSGMPFHRRVGSVALSFITKFSSGYWHIFDPQNGYSAMRVEMLKRLPLDDIATGYPFENDLLIRLNILAARVTDVPMQAVYGEEVSTMKISKVAPAILMLLFFGFWKRILWKYVVWSFSPVALFLFSGLALTLFGLVIGIWVAVESIGPATASTATVLLSVGPLLVGVQFLIQFLVLDIQEAQR